MNLWDNGCFMMKLERKYIGKWWYGPYTILNYLKEGLINAYSCSLLFRMLSIISFSYGAYRIYNYYNGTDFITLETKSEINSEDNIVINPL